MFRDLCGIGAAALLWSAAAWAQNPGDVSFTLSAHDGKTTFRVGEAIEVELHFQSTAPERYALWDRPIVRRLRKPEYDRFSIEPAQGGADPLADSFLQSVGGIAGALPRPSPLSREAITLSLRMNEWLSIRQPGHYRIRVDTTRVVTMAQPATPIPLRSNTIEIDVLAPEPGWAAEKLKEAVTELERPDPPPPQRGDRYDPSLTEKPAAAARTLRFLETPEAARALARFYEHGPVPAQAELHAGLFASPNRKELIAAMEQQVAAPDVPITYGYLGALVELVNLKRFGPEGDRPASTANAAEFRRWMQDVEMPYREKSKSTEPEYFAKLADAIGLKQGQALAVSLETLVTKGPQPPPSAVTQALIQNFAALPEESQRLMLTDSWARIASPSIGPLVLPLAEGSGPMRDAALVRVLELDPVAGRKIVLNRIRKGDVMQSINGKSRVLLSLPDETLPEMDGPLVDALLKGKPVESLIARYATDAVRDRLEASLASNRICWGPMLAYFFRVDPDFAESTVTRVRESKTSCTINLSSTEDLFTSPGLERQALEDVRSPDATVRSSALNFLQRASSPAAQQPLMDAYLASQANGIKPSGNLSRLRPVDIKMQVEGTENGFLQALLNGRGWVATPEMVEGITAACATDSCRASAASSARWLQRPIEINLNVLDSGYAFMGALMVPDRREFEKKIAQFPKGTEFYLSNKQGTWYQDQRTHEAREILEGARMKVVDRPPPAR